jgi:endoglucanase
MVQAGATIEIWRKIAQRYAQERTVIGSIRRLLERNEIGWCFWPFKRMDAGRCVITFKEPAGWSVIQSYDRSRGTGYGSIRTHRPDPVVVRRVLQEFLRQIRFESCRPNEGYIRAIGCEVPAAPQQQ